MRPPSPQTSITNTIEIYNLIRCYGHAPFQMKWARDNAFREPDKLRAILTRNHPKTMDETEQDIIYAKKCKLYQQIYELLKDCEEQFFSDIDDLKYKYGFSPQITYQLTLKTQQRLALKACKYIHPTSLEFVNPQDLLWIPTRKIAITQITEPIHITDYKFINPTEHEELVEFHDKDKNNDNRFEIRIHEYYECYTNIFPDKYHNFIQILQASQHWQI